jgi:hypothetical protein
MDSPVAELSHGAPAEAAGAAAEVTTLDAPAFGQDEERLVEQARREALLRLARAL